MSAKVKLRIKVRGTRESLSIILRKDVADWLNKKIAEAESVGKTPDDIFRAIMAAWVKTQEAATA